MTYNQLKKEIEKIEDYVKFMYAVQDSYCPDDRENIKTISGILNILFSWKNYLKFDKEYVDRGFYEMEQKNSEKYRKELETAQEAIRVLREQVKE